MTSQSPTEEVESDAYANAWASIQNLVREQGASWSGRESNRSWLNLGDGSFADISNLTAAEFLDDGRSTAYSDWDDDGRLDIILRSRTAPRLRVLHNRVQNGGSFLAVNLRGTTSNRDAIGAHVIVQADAMTCRQTLHAGEGYLCQSSKRLHFGLGKAKSVDEVTVVWPNGTSESFSGVEINGRFLLVEGSGRAEPSAVSNADSLAALAPSPLPEIKEGVVRIPLAQKIPLAKLRIPAYDDAERQVGSFTGKPVLINLWGTDCLNCLREYNAFQRRRADLDRFGLVIVPMSTDPDEARAKAREMIAKYGFDQHAGQADSRFLLAVEALLAEVVGAFAGSPLPTSLLLDQKGHLVAVYQGPVHVQDLIRDLRTLKQQRPGQGSLMGHGTGRILNPVRRGYGILYQAFSAIGEKELAAVMRSNQRQPGSRSNH